MAQQHFERFEEGTSLNVQITDEGVIFDAFDESGECIGTMAMTFDEWFEKVDSSRPMNLPPVTKLPVHPTAEEDEDQWFGEQEQYLVTWDIQVDAVSPGDAARQALGIMRDPQSLATVFTVNGPTSTTVIDLDDAYQQEP